MYDRGVADPPPSGTTDLPSSPQSKRRSRAHCCSPAIAASTCTATTASISLASTEAGLARSGLVDLDVPAFELGIVELANGVGDFFRSRHFDKAEAFRLSGALVRDDSGALHLADL
jgi:hypothetical protein